MSDTQKHLLIVDDEKALREAIAERLADHGFVVEQAPSGEQALERLADFAFDVIITDLRLPGIDGRRVLDAALERYPEIIGIVITGFGTVKDAVEAIKQGAADFITKPFQFDALLHVLNSALEQRRLKSENAYLRSQLEERYKLDGLVGRSSVMRDLFHLLEIVASTSSTVLITGETGTGKELAARAIHHNSARRNNRFVAINCSAIPETLLEAELFGHTRGAFTGAVAMRQGRFEQAHKGTLFLDEVGTMSPALQAKLLRVLQEREFERVGDSHTTKVDVRVIAATHSDLHRMVAEGTFREDLFYRLNVIPVKLPPLRERREDIPLLVQHFIQRLSADSGRPPVKVSQEAMRRLMAHPWPGNVRQLENAVERGVAFTQGRGQIDLLDLSPDVQDEASPTNGGELSLPEEGIDFETYISGIELSLIRRSLERTQGNKRQAARLLKLKRTTLIEKLKRLEPRQ
ncbi:MAG TPA: sigma-54 dependent transcriptional regulator [Vicinamibacterales bacterium]|jgi:two-component system response regulator PilR (NtrC family)|nr:sigma-54 dependent transcriptional regulator [Vicinamibacterales bacterium]